MLSHLWKTNVLSNISFAICKCFQFGKPKILSSGNGLTKWQNVRCIRIESNCRWCNKCDLEINIVLDRILNIKGKEESARYHHFSYEKLKFCGKWLQMSTNALDLEKFKICHLIVKVKSSWKLPFSGVKVAGQWKEALEVVRPHIDDHVLTFNDNHILLACLGAEDEKATEQMMNSITDFIQWV